MKSGFIQKETTFFFFYENVLIHVCCTYVVFYLYFVPLFSFFLLI